MALPATQTEMINYLRQNFWKMKDDTLFTSLKTITDSSYYQNTSDAPDFIRIQNCGSLITSLGIPINEPWIWTTNEMSTISDYTILVGAPDANTLIIKVAGGSTSVSVKSFLISLSNRVGLENFQFRCIDQRDNSLNFRIGRFPSNFLTLFPAANYRFEIRPIFCDNRGTINRDHSGQHVGNAKHAARFRIMEEYGRGDDSYITLPWHLNSAITMNVQSDSSMSRGANLAGMYQQIDTTVQDLFVNRGHRLLNQPYLNGGYGKAKILNDFHGQGRVSVGQQTGSYWFISGTDFMPECGGLGPKNSSLTWYQEGNKPFFTSYANILYKPYVLPIYAIQIANAYKSDTPAWDSALTSCQFDLENFCRHKRISMHRKGPGMYGRNVSNPAYHSYSRIQYTMALVIWKHLNGHYQPFAIIADQGRFFDFEENIATTKSKFSHLVSGYLSQLVRTTVNGTTGYMFAPESGTNVLSFQSSAYMNWSNFTGLHIWLENGYYGYLKKVSISGNTITVKGDLMPIASNTWDRVRYYGIQATVNTSSWSSNKRITITSSQAPISGNAVIGAAIYNHN